MPTVHGSEPRGLSNVPTTRSYDGRFGRLFQNLADQPAHDPVTDDNELRAIAESMAEGAGIGADNPRMPAGFVYAGQFVDHDITFDPTSQLQRRNDPEGLINFRTPRFDLDSVYGSGPSDEPFQYDGRNGDPASDFRFLIEGDFDMPRNSLGRALIGDPRNDENGIVSQLHVAFMKLHNRLMDDMSGEFPDPGDCFNEAQREAQWHYQWVVVHDFLRRLVGDALFNTLVTRTPGQSDEPPREIVRLRHYRHKKNPYLPVEFSVAAYRYGHSQVRDEYSINGSFHRRLFDPNGDDFRGFQALRPGWQASWPFFFEMDETGPQQSRAIDTSLAPTLMSLQGGSGDGSNLALRILRRGAALGLPSGQAVAREMGEVPLTDDELAPASPDRAPLWFYVLREAQIQAGGQHLGAVGGRIVGETLLGLLRADPQSYLTLKPSWTPTLPARNSAAQDFDLVDLLQYAVPDQAVRF